MRRMLVVVIAIALLEVLALPLSAAGMRGLWVDAFHPGYRSADETTKMVEQAKECNFNALFVQVRRRGDVFYDSSIEPMAKEVQAGYDPLADIVKQAHAAGIKVHAWITTYEVYHDTKWNAADPNQVHVLHPDWLTKDDRGRSVLANGKVYLDPGLSEVRTYLGRMIAEIVTNYEVDGVHLDCVRYPNEQAGYNEGSLARFKEQSKTSNKPEPKDSAWSDWRRSQVTEFVRLAKGTIRRAKRPIELSAAVSANRTDSYFGGFQDWVGWLKTGLLDFAVPMVFPTDDRVFQAEVADLLKAAGPKTVYIGQGGWRMSVKHSLKQIDMALGAGAPGVVLYSYNGCRSPRKGEKASLMQALDSHLAAQ